LREDTTAEERYKHSRQERHQNRNAQATKRTFLQEKWRVLEPKKGGYEARSNAGLGEGKREGSPFAQKGPHTLLDSKKGLIELFDGKGVKRERVLRMLGKGREETFATSLQSRP